MRLEGIHHVTCITADAPSNADFYVRVMGLRIVKKSINQTDMTSYHIFYGDERASYGNNISFFEYRGRPDGRTGAGNVHRLVWRLGTADALDFWERRLGDEGIVAERDETTLRFADHDGLDHELAVVDTADPPLTGESPEIPAEYALQGIDGLRAFATDEAASLEFLTATLGFSDTGTDGRHEVRGSRRGGWYALDPAPAPKRRFGAGCVQHVAWGCDPADIEDWAAVVAPIDPKATGVIDRHFFRSVYFTEPGGVLFEIAEFGGPGFAVDEPDLARMGDTLTLPPWLEERRKLYEYTLTPVPTTDELRAGILAGDRAGAASR
jgi:glyoxalase family protein